MMADFAMVIGVAFVLGTWQKKTNFLMSLFPTIITKEIFRRNVAFIGFVGRITIVVCKKLR
jgi:hypothetical protein